MRVLVTGATGFLGGALVHSLRARGESVVAHGRDLEKLAALGRIGAMTCALDLANTAKPGDGIGAVDAVVHCAALSRLSASPAAFHAANVTGTRNALSLARKLGARRFINISSSTVYFALRDQENVPETSPLPSPINAYAATKAQAEQLVLETRDVATISLRPRGIYGAGDTALLPRLVAAATRGPLPLLRGGLGSIDLTHVSDVVSAIEAALDADNEVSGEVFNISGGEPLAIRAIVEAATTRAGVAARWRVVPLGPALAAARVIDFINSLVPQGREPVITRYSLGLFAFRQSLDIRKAGRLLGWTPRVRFAQGLELTFEKPRSG